MNIIITGSTGRISQPLTRLLVQQGHTVTVISSKPERQAEIRALGATPAIGSIDDPGFLATAFRGADIVYLMEPPINFFHQQADTETYWTHIARSYVQAVQQSGVRQVVHLSSIGGHTDEGNGMLRAHHQVENILKELPVAVSIKTMRPVGFYYNMYAFIPAIKNQGAIVQNYGGDEKEPWVSPQDIAETIAAAMEAPFAGRTVQYIASDEVSPNEAARILGEAIGLPGLEWKVIPDETFRDGLIAAGFNASSAAGLTAMNAGRRQHLYDDYRAHRPALGRVKLRDFARDFAAAYHQQNA